MRWLPEPEYGEQGLVDAPQLLRRQVPHQIAQPGSVHRTDLFDEDAGEFPLNVNFGPERGRAGTPGAWRHQDHGPGQQFVRLHDHQLSKAV